MDVVQKEYNPLFIQNVLDAPLRNVLDLPGQARYHLHMPLAVMLVTVLGAMAQMEIVRQSL
jgi:hypothetical protein